MGEVDDAHHAVDEGEAAGDEEQDGCIEEGVEDVDEEEVHQSPARYGTTLTSGFTRFPLQGQGHGHPVDARLEPAPEIDDQRVAVQLLRRPHRRHLVVGPHGHEVRHRHRLLGDLPDRRPPERLAHDLIRSLELRDALDLGLDLDPRPALLAPRHEGAEGNGEAVEGPDPEGIREIAEDGEDDAAGRPARELIGAVGDEQMPVLAREALERGPALPRLLDRHEPAQGVRDPGAPLEAVGQADQRVPQLAVAHEVEPRDAAAPGLGLRERGEAPGHRLLHDRRELPGHGAPRRGDGRRLLGSERVLADRSRPGGTRTSPGRRRTP